MQEKNRTQLDLIFQQTWNQYNIYYQSYMIYNSKFNTIGVVASVFIVVLLAIANSWSTLLYIPILGLLIPFVLTLLNLKYDGVQIPWIDKEHKIRKSQIGKTEFYEECIEDVMQATNTLLTYKKIVRKRIALSIWSIFISLVFAFFITLYKILQPIFCG